MTYASIVAVMAWFGVFVLAIMRLVRRLIALLWRERPWRERDDAATARKKESLA